MSPRAHRGCRHCQGFTLVELLIALLLTGLVAMLVFGAFRIATGSWERVIGHQERAHESYLVQTFVRRLLEQAQPLRVRDIETRLSVAMLGDAQQLVFVTELPTPRGLAELYWCQLRVVDPGDGRPRQLVMSTRPYTEGEVIDWRAPLESTGEGLNGEQIAIVEPQERVLLRGVAQLELEYLYYDDSDQPEWRNEWRDESVLPYLVRLRALPEGVDGLANEASVAFWPEVTVSPTEYRYGGKTLL
ncbi:prepilin-type N-terminal cleavage/methylation domain-containing protein [Marinobacterium rhizophilum]|uniref:Prepilin-type N-terminal cleavage/methylation domain-containing protein n=1 Tax=Marinobacterium rhizophilum TaxID=420402 RepID=A0ABY5HLQ3_9GAMM|nr:prepilin-type N-terminal cleavage/methylation domain-containing protein [Marinobacterium rhizophilum]UTW12182.1 prepilin-type N-terminal cleavage/methylation domain-containing protein [Marinobacterium rhizophilum]